MQAIPETPDDDLARALAAAAALPDAREPGHLSRYGPIDPETAKRLACRPRRSSGYSPTPIRARCRRWVASDTKYRKTFGCAFRYAMRPAGVPDAASPQPSATSTTPRTVPGRARPIRTTSRTCAAMPPDEAHHDMAGCAGRGRHPRVALPRRRRARDAACRAPPRNDSVPVRLVPIRTVPIRSASTDTRWGAPERGSRSPAVLIGTPGANGTLDPVRRRRGGGDQD
jgi:hypothetical protein